MFGGDKGKTRRVHNLQADVAALEAALEAAKAEYDRVLDRNLKVRPLSQCCQSEQHYHPSGRGGTGSSARVMHFRKALSVCAAGALQRHEACILPR